MKKITGVTTGTFLLALGSGAVADDFQPGLTLNPNVGYYAFDSDRGFEDELLLGIGVGYQFANPWAIELNYLTQETETDRAIPVDVDHQQYRLDGLYHLSSDPTVQPYVAFGAGEDRFELKRSSHRENHLNLGGGVKYFLNEMVALRADARGFYGTDNEEVDYAVSLGMSLLFGQSTAPVVPAAPPAPRDSDADGVADTLDQCPDTAHGLTVDARGCERDRDGDGVVDNKDQCPDSAPGSQVDGTGCALVPTAPDSDRDGVIDALDRCPGTLAGLVVDTRGCEPDADQDGVPDRLDQCSDSSAGAKVDAQGCYIKLTETRTFNLSIQFQNNSLAVSDTYRNEIAALATFMREYPETDIVIEGHTDDRGKDSYNQRLSEQRAQAVADVLVKEFGVDAGRVRALGKGEAEPIADNSTAEGRAANRRVVALVSAKVTVIQK
jgi:OOP family OmpA-OmpF porin